MNLNSEIERLIDHFGGTQVSCGKVLGVKQATVWGWLNNRHGMDAITALKIENMTDGSFKAEDLCPKLKTVS